jgi:hypothetical protein
MPPATCRLSTPFHPMQPYHAAMQGPSTALLSSFHAPHCIPFPSAIPPAPAFLPTAATLHDVPEKSQGGSLPPQFYLVPFLAPFCPPAPPTAAQANSSCVHCPAAILLPTPRPLSKLHWLRSNRHRHFMRPLFPASKSELGSVCACAHPTFERALRLLQPLLSVLALDCFTSVYVCGATSLRTVVRRLCALWCDVFAHCKPL